MPQAMSNIFDRCARSGVPSNNLEMKCGVFRHPTLVLGSYHAHGAIKHRNSVSLVCCIMVGITEGSLRKLLPSGFCSKRIQTLCYQKLPPLTLGFPFAMSIITRTSFAKLQ